MPIYTSSSAAAAAAAAAARVHAAVVEGQQKSVSKETKAISVLNTAQVQL
jgi:hypothetical protein